MQIESTIHGKALTKSVCVDISHGIWANISVTTVKLLSSDVVTDPVQATCPVLWSVTFVTLTCYLTLILTSHSAWPWYCTISTVSSVTRNSHTKSTRFKSLEFKRTFIGHLGQQIFRIRELMVKMVQYLYTESLPANLVWVYIPDSDAYEKGNRHLRDLNDDGTPSLSMFGGDLANAKRHFCRLKFPSLTIANFSDFMAS